MRQSRKLSPVYIFDMHEGHRLESDPQEPYGRCPRAMSYIALLGDIFENRGFSCGADAVDTGLKHWLSRVPRRHGNSGQERQEDQLLTC